jgi:actin-like ATPase involved in cell morphogenesis
MARGGRRQHGFPLQVTEQACTDRPGIRPVVDVGGGTTEVAVLSLAEAKQASPSCPWR